MEIKKINHIAVVVPDIKESITLWKNVFGLTLESEEDAPSQKAKLAIFKVGESKLELVQPSGDESGLAKFLRERGPGMHHLCLEVENLDMVLLELRAKEVRLINETPQIMEGRKMAFIHPKATGGVLIELYEVI